MSQHPDRIAPHGGILVNRIATLDQRQEFFDKAEALPRIQLSERSLSDLQMIAIGAFSPLSGFMDEANYRSVVKKMRLSSGLPWSVPITLSVSEEVAAPLIEGRLVRLDSTEGTFVGVLELTEKYRYSKEEEVLNVYRTDDLKHPGVQVVDKSGPVNLAGPVWLLERELDPRFPNTKLTRRNREYCSKKEDGKL
jgi:sulfate adenylyltransferase (EC 2.7.7.4)